jgi:hypothetical protein
LYPSWAAFGIVFIICVSLMTIRGCESYKAAEVEIERIHFNGQYEQRMVVGHGYPVWVKIAADTIESTPDSLQQAAIRLGSLDPNRRATSHSR